MSSHAGKTAFFEKNASGITPNLVLKSVQNTSKIEPKRGPKRSRRPPLKKDPKTHPKGVPKASQNDPKEEPKITKNGLGGLSFTSKNNDFLEGVFSRFLRPQDALDP